jgi:type I restriction enzyme S subunit
LYPEEFFRLPIIQPPAEEQKKIVQAIHVETADVNTDINRLEREIELLREYRIRLVADVITGKLDVREAAVRLPNEATTDIVEEELDDTLETDTIDGEAAV